MKYFYWDSHKNLPTRLPEKVKKEFIYHVSLDRRDSILENEITYNSNRQPVEVRKYAVPSKGELIQIDSLQYINGLLVKEVKYSQAYFDGFDTTIIEYQYDNFGRVISKSTNQKYNSETLNYTYVSDNKENKIKTIIKYRAGDESKDIYFYGASHKIDSIQRLTNNKWYETAQFEYDTLTNTKFIYLKYSTHRALRTKVIYSKDGYPKYSLTNELPNWNQTKIYNLEIIELYHNDGTTKECEIIIDGKKRFSKVHTYITFK